MQRLEELDHTKDQDRTPAGYAFYMRVEKKRNPNQYQDGTPLEEQELSFFHATDAEHVHSVLDSGLRAGYGPHEVEGLGLCSLLTPVAFGWGWKHLEGGGQGEHVLHVKVPASAWKTDVNSGTTLLRQNALIRGGSDWNGHLRFVLQGKSSSSFLRCRIVGIYVHVRRHRGIDESP